MAGLPDVARGRRGADDDYDEDDEPKAAGLAAADGRLGGEAEKLTDAPEGIAAYDWLPNSSGIVYLAREPRPKPLQTAYEDKQDRKDDAVVERAEKFRQQIWRIDREDKKAEADPSRRLRARRDRRLARRQRVAFTTNYTGEVNDYHKADVWTVEIETGETRQLTDGPGGKYHPVWTPDGSSVLLCRSARPGSVLFAGEPIRRSRRRAARAVNLTADFPA